MKTSRLLRQASLLLALVTLTGLQSWATPITVASYSTTIASSTNNLYKDSTYSGTAITTAPTMSYSGGTGKLTDGATNASNAWVAWYGEAGFPTTLGHPTLVFDFGAEAMLDEVSLYFWQYTPNLIRLPTALHVDYSDDGITYGGTQNFTLSSGSIPNGTTGWLDFTLTGSGRYARLVLDNVGRDTLISEVQFQGSLVPTGSSSVPDSASTALCLGLALSFLAATRGLRRAVNVV